MKRTLDIASALTLLILSLPALAVAVLLIKWKSEGPVLFCQERMGRNFKTFRLFKLRTMKHCLDGSSYTFGNDPRITRVGCWLRLFKIDELPQLWNVLRGDMSMVGPRPVIPELAREFKESYERLLVARPGLTDPATLKYCREAEMLGGVADPMAYFKTVVTPDKLLISETYQERATILKDLCVMAATALALLLPTQRTLLIPTETHRASVLLFPVPVPAVKMAPRREARHAHTPFEYPLDGLRQQGLTGLRHPPPVHSGKSPAADGVKRMRLVP